MSSGAHPYGWIESSLQSIHKANWYRSVRTIATRPGSVITVDGQAVVNFASNDYLGLAGDDRLIQAAIAALQTWGTGSTGSRLLSGHRSIHQELEQAIADWKQTEAAIAFSSGYLANLGTITALVGERDLILGDQFNHSSLKQGARLSGAAVLEYAHVDMQDLQAKVQEQRARYRRCLILTDSVFSMDGDLCPLPTLLDLADQFGCMVLVDEAHGTGVLGTTGSGCVEHFCCREMPLIQMGTFSKALGSLGGYIAGSNLLIEFLRNRAATWIYTTGLSPADAAAAREAIRIAQAEPERRSQLWSRVEQLKVSLLETWPQRSAPEGLIKLLPSASPILCLQMPKPKVVLQVSQALRDRGFWVPAIRPPTVPTSRLRISLMATHTKEQVEALAIALQEVAICKQHHTTVGLS